MDSRGIAQDDLREQSIVNAIPKEWNGHCSPSREALRRRHRLRTDNFCPISLHIRGQHRSRVFPAKRLLTRRSTRQHRFLVDNPFPKWTRLNEFLDQTKTTNSELAGLKRKLKVYHNEALEELTLLFDWLDTLTP